MEIVSPSGRVYRWDGKKPPTKEDIAKLQEFEAKVTPTITPPISGAQPLDRRGLGDMIKGIGGFVADVGMEAGGASIGQGAGALTGPASPVLVPALGALGGAAGNALGQLRRGEDFKWGEVAGAAAGGAIPGASLAKAPASAVAKKAAGYAAGNLAAKTIETGIDEGRLPTTGEAALAMGSGALSAPLMKYMDRGAKAAAEQTRMLNNAIRDKTLADARLAGYVIPPSKINPSAINNVIESFAGKAATAQEAALRNQEITNALAKKAIGIPANAPFTVQAIEAVRKQAAAPYDDIARISKQAAKDLDALKQARFNKTAWYKFYDRQGDPDALKKAMAMEKQATTLETKLEKTAVAAGKPELVDAMREARKVYAKTYEVERALNLADGNISAPVLGRSLDKGTQLTEELGTIAKFQQAFPAYAREGASIPPSGVNKLKVMTSAAAAGVGGGTMGAPGIALGIVPLLDDAAKAGILSKSYQKYMASPRYTPNAADFAATFSRLGAQTAGRDGSPPDLSFMLKYMKNPSIRSQIAPFTQ